MCVCSTGIEHSSTSSSHASNEELPSIPGSEQFVGHGHLGYEDGFRIPYGPVGPMHAQLGTSQWTLVASSTLGCGSAQED